MVDQRPRRLRGDCDYDVHHRDEEKVEEEEKNINLNQNLDFKKRHDKMQKWAIRSFPRTARFSCWWSIPQSPLNIGSLQWLRVSAKRLCSYDRFWLGSSF